MKKDTHNNFIQHGSLVIEDLKVIMLIGDINKVDEFLQGQVTSDHTKIEDGGFQLSSICNHKGQVISDFFINKSKDGYCFVINNDLQDVLIKELTPFAMLHRVGFKKINSNVVGHVSPSKYIDNAYCSNDDFKVSISIKESDYEHSDSITYENWQAANKILGILFLHVEDTVKYRPIEINYDNLRVSFDKGCYRGQEIVARMKYLGVDRRKFCTIVAQQEYTVSDDIKITGEIVNLDNIKVFNAIIKTAELDHIRNDPKVITII